jgi:hypothetical protein
MVIPLRSRLDEAGCLRGLADERLDVPRYEVGLEGWDLTCRFPFFPYFTPAKV